MRLFVPLGVGREQAPRSSGSGFAEIVAGTASLRLLVTGLHIIELRRNLRNGHLVNSTQPELIAGADRLIATEIDFQELFTLDHAALLVG